MAVAAAPLGGRLPAPRVVGACSVSPETACGGFAAETW